MSYQTEDFLIYDAWSAGRPYGIDNITIHHVAGNSPAWAIANTLNNRGVSAHYCIGNDGIVGTLVEEQHRAWHAGDGIGFNSKGNDRGIGIEVTNDEVGGNWHVSDKSFEILVELCYDIAKRNGLLPLKRGTTLTAHCDLSSTSCPGPYLYNKLDELCDRVNNFGKKKDPVWVKMDNPRIMVTKAGAKLVTVKTGEVVKTYSAGTSLNLLQKTEYNGKTYLRTEWSTNNNVGNGFLIDDLEEKVKEEPKQDITEPKEDITKEEPKTEKEPIEEPKQDITIPETPINDIDEEYAKWLAEGPGLIYEEATKIKENKITMKLPSKVYEALRWVIWTVIPAADVLLTTLAKAWGWNIPLEQILITMAGVSLFIGTILGIAKLSNDKGEE